MFVLKFFHALTVFTALAAHWLTSMAINLLDRVDRFFLDIAYANGDKEFRYALLIALLQQEQRNFNVAKANGLGYEAKLKTFYPAPEGGDSNSAQSPQGTVVNASEPQVDLTGCIECKARDNLNTYNGTTVCDDCLGVTATKLLKSFNDTTQALYQVSDNDIEPSPPGEGQWCMHCLDYEVCNCNGKTGWRPCNQPNCNGEYKYEDKVSRSTYLSDTCDVCHYNVDDEPEAA